MSKNYQKAARGCLYALAVVIAGVCFSVKPAQSATCFLPSGNCSTGKIGGGPAPEATPEYCTGYNINQKSYNEKYSNSSCFSCESCTKTVGNKETVYKCDEVSGSNWDNQHDKCCTDNTKYDVTEGACCPAGGCKHDCPAGKSWSTYLQQCACPSDVETDSNGNCCASGQVLENGSCTTPCEMNACDGYTYTTDPGNSESCNLGCNKGYRYKCKAGYTYSNGKCVEVKNCTTDGYTLTAKKDSNCYSCSACPMDSSKYKCEENVKTGYKLSGGTCTYQCSGYNLTSAKDSNCYSCSACPADSSKYKCEENVKTGYQIENGTCNYKCSDYTLTAAKDSNCYSCSACPMDSSKYKCEENVKTGYQLENGVCSKKDTCPSGFTTSTSCDTNKGFTLLENPNYPGCYKCQCQNQGVINGKCTNCGAEGYTQLQRDGYVCTDACPLTPALFKTCTCTATCPSGYSFDKTSVSDCGIKGSGGWTFDSKTVCGKTCGKCTAKTCPSGYRTGDISCTSQSANKIPFGYTYSDTSAGDESCKKCRYRYRYTCEDYGKVNVGGGCGLKICSYPCGSTYCNYSTRSDRQYTTFNYSCYEYTPGQTEWYVDE